MTVLQVVVAGGGQCGALVTGAKGTTVLYYASTLDLNTYWQLVFPNRPIPSSILILVHLLVPLYLTHNICIYYISLRSLGKNV